MRSVVFMLGLAVSLWAGAEQGRVVSTDAKVTEIVVSLGAGERLVGVDVTSHLPVHLKGLPNVGYHRQLPAEGLLSLQPDVVIGSTHMGPEATISALQSSKVKLVQLPAAENANQLREQVVTVAETLGHENDSRQVLAALDQQIEQLERQLLKGKKVVFLLMMDATKLRVAGVNTGGDAFIHLIGGSNAVDFANYRNLSMESLVALQPEVILIAAGDPDFSVKQFLQEQGVLAATPAVRQQQVYRVNGSALVAGLSLSALSEAVTITSAAKDH